MSPAEMKTAAEKVKAAGNDNIILCERGTFFGYNKLVNDFAGLKVMKSHGYPVSFDVTHSTQQPAGLGTTSGGDPSLSPLLAHAAIAAGYDGLFIECHPDPKNAKSDAATVLDLKAMPKLLEECAKLYELRKSF
jgi:2-dehydro-3-deoxyphosphooctonate aldolase (KDO 8-P synthase)